MNFFLKALLRGKLSLTSTLEAKMRALPAKVARYHQIEQSEALSEFERLNDLFQSKEFQANQAKFARLNELKGNRRVKLYNKLLANEKLQAYLTWSKDEAAYAQLADAEAVKKDPQLKQMKKIDASSDLKAWQGLEKSDEVIEYLKLTQEVIDYTQDINRMKDLKKDKNIQFYQETDKNQIARYDASEKIFEDEFDLTQIDKNGWRGGFAYPKGFQPVHSYTNEQQAYTGGQNIVVKDGILYIETRKEKKTAAAWDEKKGLVMKEFDYTSDVIYNTQAFEEGTVLQAKVRCRGFVNHGIYLRSDKHVPFISLFNYTDRAVYCGIKANLKENDYTHEVNGLQPIPFSIYTLVWGKDEIVWYLNDLEIHRTKNIIPKGEKMYLHLYSFQFNDKRISEGTLEVDWIKAYKANV